MIISEELMKPLADRIKKGKAKVPPTLFSHMCSRSQCVKYHLYT